MNIEVLVLRVLHVVGAITWGGTAFFVAWFLLPALGEAGPAAGPLMAALVKRRLFVIIPVVAVITMLAGLRLLWITSHGFSPQFLESRVGLTYVAGAVAALAAFTTFMSVNYPIIGGMGQLQHRMAQAADAERGALAAQMNALRGGAASGALISALLLMVATIAMAVGRYVA